MKHFSNSKKIIVPLIKIALTVLLVYFLFKSGAINKSHVQHLVNPKNIKYALSAGTCFIIAQIIAAFRLYSLIRTESSTFTFSRSLSLTIIGNFFNLVVPGTVGGDLIKGSYLIKKDDLNAGQTTSMLFVDRLAGAMALLLIAFISALYYTSKNKLLYDKVTNNLITYTVAIVAIIFVAFVVRKQVKCAINAIIRKVSKFMFFEYLFCSLKRVAHDQNLVVLIILISLAIHFLVLIGIYIVSQMLPESSLEFFAMAAVSSIVLVFGSVPITPGNLGWLEAIANFGWHLLGSDSGAAIFLYWRVIIASCSLPGGLLLLKWHWFGRSDWEKT